MGHAEMLLAVAGLKREEVKSLTRKLAAGDWSDFPQAQRTAFALAYKLSKAPATIADEDRVALVEVFGRERAVDLIWYVSWCNYMTRVADAFQLPLERENCFMPPEKKDGKDGAGARGPTPAAREPDRPPPLDCTGKDGIRAADVRRAREAWANYLGRKVEETIEIADGVKMTFVLVPPGKFRMGSPEDEKDRDKDETLHEVTLTEPFDLSMTEVTQKQYQALAGKNPSKFKGADRPVEQVSWTEARDWAVQLTTKRQDKHQYRLPTEAEWEYACRGGRPSADPFGVGNGHALSSREANFNGNFPYGGAPKGPYPGATSRVAAYEANPLGLFDMHGNVWEWCQDWFGPYPAGAVTNPTGPEEGSVRVFRGGCWGFGGASCRAADRGRSEPEERGSRLGFRLARSLPPPRK
jgi:formylglycine-generating enzyme required for sulfatase activity